MMIGCKTFPLEEKADSDEASPSLVSEAWLHGSILKIPQQHALDDEKRQDTRTLAPSTIRIFATHPLWQTE